jgi:hypothetical protein
MKTPRMFRAKKVSSRLRRAEAVIMMNGQDLTYPDTRRETLMSCEGDQDQEACALPFLIASPFMRWENADKLAKRTVDFFLRGSQHLACNSYHSNPFQKYFLFGKHVHK